MKPARTSSPRSARNDPPPGLPRGRAKSKAARFSPTLLLQSVSDLVDLHMLSMPHAREAADSLAELKKIAQFTVAARRKERLG